MTENEHTRTFAHTMNELPSSWHRKVRPKRAKYYLNYYLPKNLLTNIHNVKILTLLLMNLYYSVIESTSINYGISNRPITDISLLMPTLCQNQSVICEGSFCIPGVKKCVCDLRQPVAFGRFCLRQVDIETKCFATNQCNHTIKDAVCIDSTSQAVLDFESTRFKLEQWQHLNELRQMSQSTQSKKSLNKETTTTTTTTTPRPEYLARRASSAEDGLILEARDDVIMTNLRNSPYEITTPELMQQNHTRRRQNVEKMLSTSDKGDESRRLLTDIFSTIEPRSDLSELKPTSTVSSIQENTSEKSTTTTTTESITTQNTNAISTTTSGGDGELSKKKLVVKTPNWPPGVCSCPHGFMFDAMLRKCLSLSLADTHCQSDNDCRQIKMTHCSDETKKCECDEPFVWSRTELTCQRPTRGVKPDYQQPPSGASTTTKTSIDYQYTSSTRDSNPAKEGLLENLISPLLLAKLLPDQTMLLFIFVIVIIVATLCILGLTVKCFSSNNAALISPKSPKSRHNKNVFAGGTGLPPRSPYASLKRPEYHNKHSQFTQATRGRILNYDFEQDSPTAKATNSSGCSSHSHQPLTAYNSSATMHRGDHAKSDYKTTTTIGRQTGGGTLSRLKVHKHGNGDNSNNNRPNSESTSRPHSKASSDVNDQESVAASGKLMVQELNDNISVSQLDLESGSENSKSETSSLAAPPLQSNQPPPYMLASSSMKGQSSAIAAAAAAVANRRMQMALKKTSAGDQQQSSKIVANGGSPVFL